MKIFIVILLFILFSIDASAFEIIEVTEDITFNFFFSLYFYMLLMLFGFFALIAILVSSI
ncbi:MAG: hypothetical protein COB67_08895 [SAR324 cluster bacterium]|uniref:Uncharacterized protein n=1 Tax=SAR324 cluster bacterium TaxID=2024889 RepID=A0A2A4T1R1_9DELT|nr:MAG: hypothetical protein COB67_08895 [SAR324 cluster bacterium]